MKKPVAVLLSLLLLFSVAFAEGDTVSLGALLYRDSALLYEGHGITIRLSEYKQSGPEFFFTVDCSNENDRPVFIWFTNHNSSNSDLADSGFLLNDEHYYAQMIFRDEKNGGTTGNIPAHGEHIQGQMVIDPAGQLTEPFLTLKDVTEGAFCMTAHMATTEEELEKGEGHWPVFFTEDCIRFTMDYDGNHQDETELSMPSLETYTDGTAFFNADGITLTFTDGELGMDFSTFHPALMGHAVLRNDNDRDLSVILYDVLINGRKGGAFTLSPDGQPVTVPAQGEVTCEYSLSLLEAMMPEEMDSMTLVLCGTDPATGENIVYHPLVLTVTR